MGDFKSEIIPFPFVAYETRKFLLVCVAQICQVYTTRCLTFSKSNWSVAYDFLRNQPVIKIVAYKHWVTEQINEILIIIFFSGMVHPF